MIILLIIIIVIVSKNKKNNKPIPYQTNVITTKNIEQKDQSYKDKYKGSVYLLTQNELKFYRILRQITNKLGYSLFCQVSLYEIIKAIEYKDFNKIRSKTIDFVITQENCKILMCIELDDITHQRKNRIERDNFINKLFKDLEIKLIRIPVQNFYNMEQLEAKIKERS